MDESDDSDDDDLMIDTSPDAPPPNLMAPSSTTLDPSLPAFAALPASAQVLDKKDEFRRVIIPPHRMTPLKKEWINIYTPLVEMAGLQVRMNVKRKCVEIKVSLDPPRTDRAELWSESASSTHEREFADPELTTCRLLLSSLHCLSQTSKHTQDVGQIQKGADFLKAFALGFDVNVSSHSSLTFRWSLLVPSSRSAYHPGLRQHPSPSLGHRADSPIPPTFPLL